MANSHLSLSKLLRQFSISEEERIILLVSGSKIEYFPTYLLLAIMK